MKSQHASNKCPSCGAKIDLRPEVDGLVTCKYCDHQSSVSHKHDAHTGPRLTVSLSHPDGQAARTRQKTTAIVVIAIGMLLLGSGIGFFLVFSTNPNSNGSLSTTVHSVAGSAVRSVTGSRCGWDSVGGPPQIVRIAGEEHVIGRLRVYGEDSLTVRVFHAKDLSVRWSTPVLGTYGEAYRAIHFAATADRLLVSDKSNKLHVYALDSGDELKTHALTDRIEQLCVLDYSGQVWVQTLDKRNVVFDVASFEVKEAVQRPAECPRNAMMARMQQRDKVRTSAFPSVADFDAKRLFVDGEQAVVFGAKKPGTAIPIAVGFDPASKTLRWNKSILQVEPSSFRTSFYAWLAGLAGGRFVTFYGVGSDDEWRAVAFDASTGDLLWETPLKPIFSVDKVDNITVTPEYVYLVRTSSLDVLDAKTGKQVGSIGDETYD